jgi:putative PIN family toxin of toxin-antitoxin system
VIVIDASAIIGAALNPNGMPRRALIHAKTHDRLAMSPAVAAEILEVLQRSKFAHLLKAPRRCQFAGMLPWEVDWVEPETSVFDCRDPKDNKYLELALAANASTLVSSDMDLLSRHP